MHAVADHMIIEPRLMPRGPLDAAIAFVCAAVWLGALAGTAVATGYAVDLLKLYASAAAFFPKLTFIVLAFLPSFFTVSALRVDDDGIEFVRKHGTPGKIPWAEIESIEPASRSEVVLDAWMRPRLPMREMTNSLTSTGHYRIRWTGGVAHYPPLDEQRLLRAVEIARQRAERRRAV